MNGDKEITNHRRLSKGGRRTLALLSIGLVITVDIGFAVAFDLVSFPWIFLTALAEAPIIAWTWRWASDPEAAATEARGFGPEQSRNRRMP